MFLRKFTSHYLGLSEKLTDTDMLDQSGRKLAFHSMIKRNPKMFLSTLK